LGLSANTEKWVISVALLAHSDFYPTASSVLSVPEQSGPENPEPSTQYPVPTIQCAGRSIFLPNDTEKRAILSRSQKDSFGVATG